MLRVALSVHCVTSGLDTLVEMLLICVQETAPFGNFVNRTAFLGTRKLMKSLEQIMTNAIGRVSVDHTIQVGHVRYSAVLFTRRATSFAHSHLTSPHS